MLKIAHAIFDEIRRIRAALAAQCKDDGEKLALLAATLVGLGVRAFFLAQPMRLDEAYTFLYYLNDGLNPFYYNVPNNHVLHTLLAKLTVMLGGMNPVAIRFPAFVAGVLCIPAVFFVAKSFHKNAGPLAAFGMALFPYMILYSTMARGYSLIVLLTLALILVGKLYLEKPSLAGCVLIALLSALGLFTIPTMAFVLAGIYPWLWLSLWIKSRSPLTSLRDFLLPTLLMTTLLTVLFYIPVLLASNGAGTIFSNTYVNARSWKDFSSHISPHLRQIISDFFRDVPSPLKYLGVLLALVGWLDAARRRDWAAFLLIPSIVVGGAVVFFAKQAIPFVRTWIYLIPFLLLFADLAYAALMDKFTAGYRAASHTLILILGLFLAGSLVSANAITKYPDTGAFPEAATVAHYLKPLLTGDEFIAVKDTANFPLYYYLCAEGVPPQPKDLDPATVKRYFIVQNSWYKLSDLTKAPAQEIFTFGDASVYTSVSKDEPIWPGYVFECP